MQKKLTLSFITLLSSASIFIACEDNSIMDVSSNNIDKLADVEVVSVTAQSSAEIVAEVSSTEVLSSEEINGSSQDITNLSQKTDGSSETPGSSTDIFDKSSEVEISSNNEVLSSETPASSTPLSSTPQSSIATSSQAKSSIAISSATLSSIAASSATIGSCGGTPQCQDGTTYNGGDKCYDTDGYIYTANWWQDKTPLTTGEPNAWTKGAACP